MREYQADDREIVDYALYELPGLEWFGPWFRGPAVTGSEYLACVGAAQTFGRFCERPFPGLLGGQLGMESLNLGIGGVGPKVFLSPDFLAYINAARLVVVQVLSARSQSNSRFTIDDGMAGVRVADGVRMTATEFFDALLEAEPAAVAEVVAETRANYVRDMAALLDAIVPPTVLFWFSVREPEYREEHAHPVEERLFGKFPQLVNRAMVEALSQHADAYVECVTSRGLPRTLPVAVPRAYNLWKPERAQRYARDSYYPSPEMHEDAVAALLPVCRKLLDAIR